MSISKKETNTGLNLGELKNSVEKGTKIITEFGESVKASVGMSIEEFTKMRDSMKQLGIGFDALEKLTLKVQESYNEEVKKLQDQKEAALKAGKDREKAILIEYMNESIKLTDHGRKEADPEKYKAILKEKEDALEAHHLKMTVEQKVYTDNIKKLQDESQKISLKEAKNYYGTVGEVAHNTFTKISELANQGVAKVDGFLKDNAWASGALEIKKQYKEGLEEMTKDYNQQTTDIEAKYKKKKDKLEAEQKALKDPYDKLTKVSQKIETSNTKKQIIENEIKAIDEDAANWSFDPKNQEQKYQPQPKTEEEITQPTAEASSLFQEPLDGQIPNTENGEESEEDKEAKRQEQAAKRREYLQQLLDDENAYNAELIASKDEAQNKIDEINETGFKTEADLQAEMTELNKKETEEKAKTAKKIEKIKKQQAKIEYIEKIATLTKGIITSTASTAQGAATALAKGPILGPILAAMISAQGAVHIAMQTKQLAAMKNTSPFEDGGLLNGKRHRDGGMRIEGTNIEVEGGEYVVNRQSTAKNLGLLRYINEQRRELGTGDLHNFISSPIASQHATLLRSFKEGGQVPMLPMSESMDVERLLAGMEKIKIDSYVSVTDINTVQQNMARVDEWTGL